MILTIIAFIVILTVLVVVHEYGHFLLARLCKIKINEFAIGFGPKLFTWMRKNGTDFNVRLYPLGGFVSMAGESIDQMDEPDGFQAQPAWKRFLVVFAGPLFSFLFAVIIFISIGYFFGFPTGDTSNKIQMVMPDTKASKIGLRSGDEILSVNAIKSVRGSYVDIIHENPGNVLHLQIRRGKKEILFHASPDLMVRFLGVNCKESPDHTGVIFDSVSRESEIYKKGIVNNDVLISVNGTDVNSTKELAQILEQNKGNALSLVIQRTGGLKTVNISLTPYYYESGNLKIYFPEKIFLTEEKAGDIENGDELLSVNGKEIKSEADFVSLFSPENSPSEIKVKRDGKEINIKISKNMKFVPVYYTTVGAFGFMPAPNLVKTDLVDSVRMGSVYIIEIVKELFRVLTSREIKDNVGGPIAIASATHSAVNTGFFSIVLLTAGLSLSLAILNLLPIPVLDGGHIFIMFLEFLRRKRFTKEQLMNIQALGMIILILIFVAVMYSDISKLFTGGLP
ncbi:MAG: RIP metalloprotease RseP, partial [Armatimonadetes bacterium]|nr:RIP metalloprotease RseP [Candidatus Hippobium faecium]